MLKAKTSANDLLPRQIPFKSGETSLRNVGKTGVQSQLILKDLNKIDKFDEDAKLLEKDPFMLEE